MRSCIKKKRRIMRVEYVIEPAEEGVTPAVYFYLEDIDKPIRHSEIKLSEKTIEKLMQ